MKITGQDNDNGEDNVFHLIPKQDDVTSVKGLADDDDAPRTAEEIFSDCIEADMAEVVVVGITKDGVVGSITNMDSVGDVLHVLELAKKRLLEY